MLSVRYGCWKTHKKMQKVIWKSWTILKTTLLRQLGPQKFDVEIQGVQPYGKGHRVALIISQEKLRKNVLCALKELPHLYPLNKQPHINKVLKSLKAESGALTVKKAERNTTFDQYE